MKGLFRFGLSRSLLDRVLLAGVVVCGAFFGTQVSPPATPKNQSSRQEVLECTRRAPMPKPGRPSDMFVPAAPNEPLETLENSE